MKVRERLPLRSSNGSLVDSIQVMEGEYHRSKDDCQQVPSLLRKVAPHSNVLTEDLKKARFRKHTSSSPNKRRPPNFYARGFSAAFALTSRFN